MGLSLKLMTLDIFSTFDDHNKVIFDAYLLIWIIPIIVCISFFRFFWVSFGFKFTALSVFYDIIKELVKAAVNRKGVGGAVTIPSLLFCLYVLLNLWGLVPYVFSTTRHLAVNLGVGFVVWFAIIIIGIIYNSPDFFSHFLPLGRPFYLAPFLCLIELVRILVRPLTLAVRLTANLTTGHILIRLLGRAFSSIGLGGSIIVLVCGIFYHIFEFAVCLIQAYIFVLLTTLYTDEHPAPSSETKKD